MVNDVLDFGEQKPKEKKMSDDHGRVETEESSATHGVFAVRDGVDKPQKGKERTRQISLSYHLHHMYDASKGMEEEDCYVVTSNLKTRKMSSFVERSY